MSHESATEPMQGRRLAPTVLVQRIENGAVAAAILVAVVALGLPWWVLFAAFLLFDLSALGYLRGARAGAVGYNLVHNYTAPAILAACYALLRIVGVGVGVEFDWLALLAASWGFHVAVDRALGYGLKLAGFSETHLGRIGRDRVATARPEENSSAGSAER